MLSFVLIVSLLFLQMFNCCCKKKEQKSKLPVNGNGSKNVKNVSKTASSNSPDTVNVKTHISPENLHTADDFDVDIPSSLMSRKRPVRAVNKPPIKKPNVPNDKKDGIMLVEKHEKTKADKKQKSVEQTQNSTRTDYRSPSWLTWDFSPHQKEQVKTAQPVQIIKEKEKQKQIKGNVPVSEKVDNSTKTSIPLPAGDTNDSSGSTKSAISDWGSEKNASTKTATPMPPSESQNKEAKTNTSSNHRLPAGQISVSSMEEMNRLQFFEEKDTKGSIISHISEERSKTIEDDEEEGLSISDQMPKMSLTQSTQSDMEATQEDTTQSAILPTTLKKAT